MQCAAARRTTPRSASFVRQNNELIVRGCAGGDPAFIWLARPTMPSPMPTPPPPAANQAQCAYKVDLVRCAALDEHRNAVPEVPDSPAVDQVTQSPSGQNVARHWATALHTHSVPSMHQTQTLHSQPQTPRNRCTHVPMYASSRKHGMICELGSRKCADTINESTWKRCLHTRALACVRAKNTQ
jgi:hypothetical protein